MVKKEKGKPEEKKDAPKDKKAAFLEMIAKKKKKK
jgi:hypothetical protein